MGIIWSYTYRIFINRFQGYFLCWNLT